MTTTSSTELFDRLFDMHMDGEDIAPETYGPIALVEGHATITSLSVVQPNRLDALRGSELTAALKKMSTKQLTTEWRNRSPHGVAANLDRQQLIINVALSIEPLRERQDGEPNEMRKLVRGVNNALTVAADPTGAKRDAAKLARQAQFSLAGQVGAQGTKERRAEAAAQVGEPLPSKYTDDEVRLIRTMCALGWKDADVAAHFHNRTKPAMIWAIRKGISYKSVDGQADVAPEAPAPVVKTTKPSIHNRRA